MSKTLFGKLTYWKFHVFNKKSDVTWHAPVPGRDHARHILQKMKIHEIHFEMVKIQIRNSVLFEMIKIQIGNRPQSRSRPGSRPWQGPVPYSDFDHFWDVKRVCVRICMFPMFVISLSFQALFALFSRLPSSCRACRALAALKFRCSNFIMQNESWKALLFNDASRTEKIKIQRRNTLPSRVRPGTGACFLFWF